MKYLLITVPENVEVPEDVQKDLQALIPEVKVAIISGATSAVLIDTGEESDAKE